MTLSPFRFCRFRSAFDQLAIDWFERPIQTINVNRLGEFSQSADGACRVSFRNDDVGFVKPRAETGSRVVANEKIASDLARMLHLPVPPVVVREPEDGNEWDRFSALSLSCLGSARHWGEGPLPLDERSVPTLEALRVFWTWLGDVDHNGHPNNLIYEDDPVEGLSILSIDHSYIWGQGALPFEHPAASGYGTAALPLATDVRMRTLHAIQGLDQNDVDHLVTRLVGRILTNDDANTMTGWLRERTNALPRLLGVGG